MSALSVISTAQVVPVFLRQCRIRTYLVGPGGVTAGMAITVSPTGYAIPANTAVAGSEQFRGIAMETLGPGQGVDVLEEGFVAGFDLSAVAYDSLVYGQDTAGAIGTAAGTKSVPIGRVVPLSDKDAVTGQPSKLIYVRSSATTNY